MSDLINEIEMFLKVVPMSETTFGKKAVNDGKFVQRIRSGGRCWPETEDLVRQFITSHQTAQ